MELDGTPVSSCAPRARCSRSGRHCSHANVSLAEGEVDDCHIECWLHGSRFDLRTGKPDSLPATRPVPVYPVKIEGDDVLVSLTQES
ncbi:(2Fe-2S)-binding protein OS=Streptomyces fumanus OX=67302 GN=GCM10018772_65330 PE=4 SV=1 [Streptomyces fumanus]